MEVEVAVEVEEEEEEEEEERFTFAFSRGVNLRRCTKGFLSGGACSVFGPWSPASIAAPGLLVGGLIVPPHRGNSVGPPATEVTASGCEERKPMCTDKPLTAGLPGCDRFPAPNLATLIPHATNDAIVLRLDWIFPPNLATLAAGCQVGKGNLAQSGNPESSQATHDAIVL